VEVRDLDDLHCGVGQQSVNSEVLGTKRRHRNRKTDGKQPRLKHASDVGWLAGAGEDTAYSENDTQQHKLKEYWTRSSDKLVLLVSHDYDAGTKDTQKSQGSQNDEGET
jgi:hypothetical protein